MTIELGLGLAFAAGMLLGIACGLAYAIASWFWIVERPRVKNEKPDAQAGIPPAG